MKTTHTYTFKNAQNMAALADESIDLVVTSPPYPMIEMWDQIFARQNKEIGQTLKQNDGPAAFALMHRELDKVWDELYRVLKKGGIACINIGDATRTINAHFALYTNHSRIQHYMQKLGFAALPAILWRKQTNAPNKFMGSGMLPPGAYVTLEHEYILILRKGNKKAFRTDNAKVNRRASAFFWEERNVWFSDVWMDLKGTTQNLFDPKTRDRSGAYPFELPYRLITMFSVKGDNVLDPFLGMGTTMYAAMAAGRNSIGYEIDPLLKEPIVSQSAGIVEFANQRITERLDQHLAFVQERVAAKGPLKYVNHHYGFAVMTNQEKDLLINQLLSVHQIDSDAFEAIHADEPQKEYIAALEAAVLSEAEKDRKKKKKSPRKRAAGHEQQLLF
jgi:DNA modification methylase